MNDRARSWSSAYGRLHRIETIAYEVGATTPGFTALFGSPVSSGWASDVEGLVSHEALKPLSVALGRLTEAIVADDSEALWAAMAEDADMISLETLYDGSRIAVEVASSAPQAGFVLSWCVLCTWIFGQQQRGTNLYSGPNSGWAVIPCACAKVALRLRGIYGARLLVDEAHAVLQFGLRRRGMEHLGDHLADHRQLAQGIERKFNAAIVRLADDLRLGWHSPVKSVALVAALLWALGRIPECNAYMANNRLPGDRSLRRLVRTSVSLVPTDPLVQHLWMMILSEGGIDLVRHQEIAAIVHFNWQRRNRNGTVPVSSRTMLYELFATTLAKFLAGCATSSDVARYRNAYDFWSKMPAPLKQIVDPPGAYVWHRVTGLAYAVDKHSDKFASPLSSIVTVDDLRSVVEGVGESLRAQHWYPEQHGDKGRQNYASFEFIEQSMAFHCQSAAAGFGQCEVVIDTIERLREGSLDYWLSIRPPTMQILRGGVSQLTIAEESDIIERLRDQYFLVLRPLLPVQYQFPVVDLGDMYWERENDSGSDMDVVTRILDVNRAREEASSLQKALLRVVSRLGTLAPKYAHRRRVPVGNFERLIETLNLHDCPSTKPARSRRPVIRRLLRRVFRP